MKKCEEVRELLSFYLDNELHENDRKQVVKHLEVCDACKAKLDELKDMIESIGEIEEVELPADFQQKLHGKLVEAHRKSNLVTWTNKGNIFKWASAMVAGFVLLFAVVNSSYFAQLTQFKDTSKTAYVNDAHLDTVDKQAMNDIVRNQELADKSLLSKDAVQNKPSVNNKLKSPVPASSTVSGNIVQTAKPVKKDNTFTSSGTESPAITDKTMSSSMPPKTSALTLSVDDVTSASAKINDIITQNGGTVETQPQVYGIMSAAVSNDTKELIFQIPSSAYKQVMGSVEKVGTVQAQPQVQSKSTQMKAAAPQTATPSLSKPDTVTIKISLQKK